MDSLCKQGQSKEAHKVLDLMTEGGLKPNLVVYTILLLGYATDGTFTDVMNVLDTMLLNNLKPNCSMYTVMIKAYTEKGKVNEAMSLLNRMGQEGANSDLIGRILFSIRNMFPCGTTQ